MSNHLVCDFRYVGLQGEPFGVHENINKITPPPRKLTSPLKKELFFIGKDHPTIDFKKTLFVFREKKTTSNQHGNGNLYLGNYHGRNPPLKQTQTYQTCQPYWVLLHAAEGAIARAKLLEEPSLGHGSYDESSIVSIWMFP